MTKPTNAEIEAAANRLENLLEEPEAASVVVTPIPHRKTRPEHRGGYPAGSKAAAELRPPPASITRPGLAPDHQ